MPVEEEEEEAEEEAAEEADAPAVLVLANFQRSPPVDFGSAKVGEQRQVREHTGPSVFPGAWPCKSLPSPPLPHR